jgi:hypothetical protein
MGRKPFAYTVVTRGPELGHALRNQRWRYAKWPDGEELYNLVNDPTEKHNLAGKPYVAERIKSLRAALEAKRREAAEKLPTQP